MTELARKAKSKKAKISLEDMRNQAIQLKNNSVSKTKKQ
jgi:hypothetical protein